MNYRDSVLGMCGVYNHLLAHGRPVAGYVVHCTFVKRKALSFLYGNMANIMYNRFVTEGVITGEYVDFPSSCTDATLEYYCDSYRVEHAGVSASHSNTRLGKPWLGYPYPYCYYWNEMLTCCKRNCSLRHEYGYCHVGDHKSQNCSKSTWKKQSGDKKCSTDVSHDN